MFFISEHKKSDISVHWIFIKFEFQELKMCITYFIYRFLYHRYLENNENVYRKNNIQSNKIKQADDIYHCMKRLCDETQ